MNNAGMGGREFSRELLQAISAGQIDCPPDLPLLSGHDVEDLKQILRGERAPGIPIDKKRAVNALAHSESSKEATAILARILSDPEEPMRVRLVAASDLGLMPPDAAERALLDSSAEGNEMIRAEVFRSLGKVGTARVLEAIREWPDAKTDHVRRQLSLARAVIGFRAGGEVEGGDASGSLGVRWATYPVRAVEGERVREAAATLRDSTYGITLSLDTGFEIRCGQKMHHFLFLSEEIRRGSRVESLRSRKRIAGLVALSDMSGRYLAVRYLVLTTPAEEAVEVLVMRTDGVAAYVGELRPDGDGFQLALRDVGLERTATEIQGRVSNDELQLSLRVWIGQSKPKRRGVPIHA